MDKYREQLEGTSRLVRIRRIKRLVLGLILVLTFFLSAYSLMMEGAGLRPFYFPLDFVAPLVLLLLLVASAANFVFRTVELKNSKRDSQKFLIAKHSIHRALLVLLVCLLLGALLIFPLVGEIARNQLAEVRAGTAAAGATVVVDLTSRDPLALSQVLGGAVSVRQRSLFVEVTWTEGGMSRARSGFADANAPFEFTVDGSVRLEYRVEMNNSAATLPVDYELRLARGLAPALTNSVPMILFALGAANAAWAVFLWPIREKHAASSIYTPQYVEQLQAGERTYSEYSRQPSLTAQGPHRPPPAEGPAPTVSVVARVPERATERPPPTVIARRRSAAETNALVQEGN
ncbi:MAG: hypothetical protein ACRD1Z_04330, partial [Vicinamibacteria bacterium]